MRLLAAAPLVFSCLAFGQDYFISTVAGGPAPDNIPGTSASLRGPSAVALDSAGNLFIADFFAVYRLDQGTAILSRIAGNEIPGSSGDNGPATSAQFQNPSGVAVDAAGNLYIADQNDHRIWKVSNGVIANVAGDGIPQFGGDNGPATAARLYNPSDVAVDSAGSLYVTDTINHRVRKVSNGVITTVAGNGQGGFSGDNGPATSARLFYPSGVAVDAAGSLYIADSLNSRIRKVSNGVVTTVAGNGMAGFGGDNGPATSAQLQYPSGVAVDAAGNLYVTDLRNHRIRKISNGVITTVAGNGQNGFSGDSGLATSAQLYAPYRVAVDAAGNLYIADSGNFRIRKVASGVITTVGGNGTVGDNGPAAGAALFYPEGVAVDLAGNLYTTESGRVRKVSNGVITTVAGIGHTFVYVSGDSFSGDNGPAVSARLAGSAVAVDSAGSLYIADGGNHRIRKVSNGIITTVAGNGMAGFGGDNGPATSARLQYPFDVAVDSAGNLYIADYANSRIRKVSNGVITTVAGTGQNGFSGDNGPATSARLWSPAGVAVDAAGNLYVADSGNNRVRKVSNGVITTVAGNGTFGFSGDNGPATNAQLAGQSRVTVDSAGNLYIAEYNNQRIRKVSNGVITTIAGKGTAGFSGDNGPGINAELNYPAGLAADAAGRIYIADNRNQRIRLLTPARRLPPRSRSGTPRPPSTP